MKAPRAAFRRLAAAAMLLAPGPALAIVGGHEEDGPAARATLMVLSGRGGVCSAVVVAPDAVLTAAHCASGAADYRVHYKGEDGQPVLLEPGAIAVHPGYDRGAVAGRRRSIDLALVRLAAPLPARFTAAALTAEPGRAGDALIVSGYGVARERDGRSTGTFRAADLTLVEPYGVSTILVWAKGAAGSGACEGDSGGPITTASGAVMAITSWASGAGKAACGSATQGVLVGPQRRWIDTVLSGWGRTAVWR